MKPLILTILAAVSLMAAQTPAPATSAPAAPKSSTATPAPAAPAAPVKRHHKKNVTGTPAASTTNSGKPAATDSSKPATPPSK